MTSTELKDKICEIIDDKKGRDITILKVDHLSMLADYFVVCTAGSSTQLRAISEEVMDKMEDLGERPVRNEGTRDGKWAIVDFGEVIVHVFNDETRLFYSLEKLWSDGSNIEKYNEK